MSQDNDRDDRARDEEALSRNKDTDESERGRKRTSGKVAEITESEGEDKREWRSISRQILEVQELTRETRGEGKTEKSSVAMSKENI